MPRRPRFGKILRELRKKRGFTQEELAHRANLDRTYIGMLERGERQPTLDTLFALAKALKERPSSIVAKME